MVEWACSYRNSEDRVVTWGRTTSDEMCMFLGLYYPRDIKTEYCSMTSDYSGRYFGGIWMGNGVADGATTAACFQSAKPASVDKGDSFSACINDSCPKIAKEMSDVARCLATRGLGMCATECGGSDLTACGACVNSKCSPFFAPLAAASCQ
jgi:hypothetical protein